MENLSNEVLQTGLDQSTFYFNLFYKISLYFYFFFKIISSGIVLIKNALIMSFDMFCISYFTTTVFVKNLKEKVNKVKLKKESGKVNLVEIEFLY